MNLINLFASDGPAVHMTPGEIFTIGSYSITNSIFYAWITSVVILVLSITVARMVKVRPRKGLVQFFEMGTEFIVGLLASSLGSRKKALKYAPTFVTLFFFITLTNWLGLIPGVGEAFKIGETPLLRPFTADINGTLAAATVTMVLVQYYAIKESGIMKHARHYFNGSLKNPMTWFLGFFEVFGEFTRIGSLALRLFLNVAIGETIIAVFTYLGGAIAPVSALPFTILELLVGALQAYIFVMLSVMYLAVAIKHHDEHEPETETVTKAVAQATN